MGVPRREEDRGAEAETPAKPAPADGAGAPAQDHHQEEGVPVTVCVRLKHNPENLPSSVSANQAKSSVTIEGSVSDSHDRRPKDVPFDRVFAESASQETVYSESLRPLVSEALRGRDVTVLAYGQSGSGRTHSLFGPDAPIAINEEYFGVALRFVRDLFKELKRRRTDSPSFSFVAGVSFVRVVGDDVEDLFHDPHPMVGGAGGPFAASAAAGDSSRESLFHRRPGWAGELLDGVTIKECYHDNDVFSHLGEALQLLKQDGMEEESLDKPCFGAGDLQKGSSHAAFILYLSQTVADSASGESTVVTDSTVTFCEVSGSDRPRGGDVGLISLELVVNSLSQRGDYDRAGIRTRLLHLLRHCLGGGRSNAICLCCVSTLERDRRKTEEALHFASSLRKVRNQPRSRRGRRRRRSSDDDQSDLMSNIRSASVDHGVPGNIPHISVSPVPLADEEEEESDVIPVLPLKQAVQVQAPLPDLKSFPNSALVPPGGLPPAAFQPPPPPSANLPTDFNAKLFNYYYMQYLKQNTAQVGEGGGAPPLQPFPFVGPGGGSPLISDIPIVQPPPPIFVPRQMGPRPPPPMIPPPPHPTAMMPLGPHHPFTTSTPLHHQNRFPQHQQQQHHLSFSSQSSTPAPAVSPLDHRPAFPAHIYLPSVPLSTGGEPSPHNQPEEGDDDASSLPVNLPSRDLPAEEEPERRRFSFPANLGNREDSSGSVPAPPRASALEQKLTSILEESETGSQSSVADKEEESDEEDVSSDEEFDSECSDVSGEESFAATSAAAAARKEKRDRFVRETEEIVREFEEALEFGDCTTDKKEGETTSQKPRCDIPKMEQLSVQRLDEDCHRLREIKSRLWDRRALAQSLGKWLAWALTNADVVARGEPESDKVASKLGVLDEDLFKIKKAVEGIKQVGGCGGDGAKMAVVELLESARCENGGEKEQLDELAEFLDVAIENKGLLKAAGGGGTAVLSLEVEERHREHFGESLPEILGRLSLEECQSLVFRAVGRTVDIRREASQCELRYEKYPKVFSNDLAPAFLGERKAFSAKIQFLNLSPMSFQVRPSGARERPDGASESAVAVLPQPPDVQVPPGVPSSGPGAREEAGGAQEAAGGEDSSAGGGAREDKVPHQVLQGASEGTATAAGAGPDLGHSQLGGRGAEEQQLWRGRGARVFKGAPEEEEGRGIRVLRRRQHQQSLRHRREQARDPKMIQTRSSNK